MATPAEVELSPYTAAHAPRLARFVVQAYATTYRGTTLPEDTLSHIVRTEDWTEVIDKAAQTDTIIVAQSRLDDIVGYTQFGDADAKIQKIWPDARELRKLYVAQELHGRGIGSKLMEAALTHPVLACANPVYLWVWGNNTKAIGFYENKYSFREMDRRYYMHNGQTMHDSLMVRDLAP